MIKRYFKRLSYALAGLAKAYKEEASFRVHVLKMLIALVLGLWLQISGIEWLILIVIVAIVLSLEIVNSILERLVDIIKPSLNEYVKTIKDMMAAAVLIGAIAALIYALVVFLPKIIEKLA